MGWWDVIFSILFCMFSLMGKVTGVRGQWLWAAVRQDFSAEITLFLRLSACWHTQLSFHCFANIFVLLLQHKHTFKRRYKTQESTKWFFWMKIISLTSLSGVYTFTPCLHQTRHNNLLVLNRFVQCREGINFGPNIISEMFGYLYWKTRHKQFL